jgi:hypothetical protein
MATDVSPQTEPSMSRLVSGIVDDTQRLLAQQADLLKADIRKDLREAKQTGLAMGLAFGLLGIGGLLLLFMLAHLLSWLWPDLPLWGSFGIVGGLLSIAGIAALAYGWEKYEKLNPLPENSVEALKENLQWKTNPR